MTYQFIKSFVSFSRLINLTEPCFLIFSLVDLQVVVSVDVRLFLIEWVTS